MSIFFWITLLFNSSYAKTEISASNLESLIDKSPGVISYQDRMNSAQSLKGKLVRSFLPKISTNYGREQFTTGPYKSEVQNYGGIQTEINIFNSWRDSLQNQQTELEAELSTVNAKIQKSHILAESMKALSEYAYIHELMDILQEAKKQNSLNMLRAQKRIQLGLATSTDVLDFQQQKVQLEQELSRLEFEKGVIHRLINTLLGMSFDEETSIAFTNTHPEHTEEMSFSNNQKSLLVNESQLEADIARVKYQLEFRWWAPKLDLYGYAYRFTLKDREYTPSNKRNDVTFGFNLTLPLFDGGEGFRSAQSLQYLADSKQAELKQRELEVNKNQQDALQKLDLAHKLIHGAEESTKIMDKYRNSILAEYAKGVKNSPDVLQANQRWIESQIHYAEVKKNYQHARAEAIFLRDLQSDIPQK